MGAADLRQVLQDRRAERHRQPPLWRRRRRLCHGRRLRLLPAQAPLRRRARRRQDLRRHPRRGRVERRQGQGHHRAQPAGPDPRRARARGRMPGSTRPRRRWSRRTAPAPRSATWSRSRAWPRSSAARRAQHRAGVGQEQHRPPQGRRRRGRPAQGDDGRPPQAAAADAQLRAPQPEHRFCQLALLPAVRAARVGAAARAPAPRRRQRLRLWRHQFPPGDGGTCARHAEAGAKGLCRGRGQRRPEQPGSDRCAPCHRRPASRQEAACAASSAVGAKTPDRAEGQAGRCSSAGRGRLDARTPVPDPADLTAPERLFIDFGNHDELLERIAKARKAAGFDNPQAWKALQGQGIFRGSGAKPGKIALPLPRPGQPVRQHGARAGRQGAGRRRRSSRTPTRS